MRSRQSALLGQTSPIPSNKTYCHCWMQWIRKLPKLARLTLLPLRRTAAPRATILIGADGATALRKASDVRAREAQPSCRWAPEVRGTRLRLPVWISGLRILLYTTTTAHARTHFATTWQNILVPRVAAFHATSRVRSRQPTVSSMRHKWECAGFPVILCRYPRSSGRIGLP